MGTEIETETETEIVTITITRGGEVIKNWSCVVMLREEKLEKLDTFYNSKAQYESISMYINIMLYFT